MRTYLWFLTVTVLHCLPPGKPIPGLPYCVSQDGRTSARENLAWQERAQPKQSFPHSPAEAWGTLSCWAISSLTGDTDKHKVSLAGPQDCYTALLVTKDPPPTPPPSPLLSPSQRCCPTAFPRPLLTPGQINGKSERILETWNAELTFLESMSCCCGWRGMVLLLITSAVVPLSNCNSESLWKVNLKIPAGRKEIKALFTPPSRGEHVGLYVSRLSSHAYTYLLFFFLIGAFDAGLYT